MTKYEEGVRVGETGRRARAGKRSTWAGAETSET